MTRADYLLVLDVGTTTIRAMAFSTDLEVIGKASAKLKKTFPKPGWVEQSPVEIARLAKRVLSECVQKNSLDAKRCLSLGITNQRETTVLWNAATGKPIYPAIVWEDRRTAAWCKTLAKDHGSRVRDLTGLNIDPYFSATKISWVLAHVPSARRLLERGELRFGTVDSWLIWNLCEGHPHVTDATNAHRTLLVDAKRLDWSDELLAVFKIPKEILPEIKESRSLFGRLDPSIIGEPVPLKAVCGDQQSSLYAAWRFAAADRVTKVTYGTGTFIDQVAGRKFAVTEPFYSIVVPHPDGGSAYGLEGKVEKGARQVDALLGDDAGLRKFLKGLTRDADRLISKLPRRPREIVVDGGVSRDGIVTEYQAATSGIDTVALPLFDGTALGTAYLMLDEVS